MVSGVQTSTGFVKVQAIGEDPRDVTWLVQMLGVDAGFSKVQRVN